MPLEPLQPLKSIPEAEYSGCAQIRQVCKCYDEKGRVVPLDQAICLAHIEPAVPALPGSNTFFEQSRPVGYSDEAELDTLASIYKRR